MSNVRKSMTELESSGCHSQGFLLQFEFPVLLGQLARSAEAGCAEICYSVTFDHVTVAYLASRDGLGSRQSQYIAI